VKVLVTGGAGFIGSHVTEKALRLGHQVVVVDNLSSGKREHVAKDAVFYHASVVSEEMQEILLKERPEVVIHLAAQSVVPVSIHDPQLDADVNVKGMLRLLEGSRMVGVRKVIFSSTAAVYGEPESFPIREEQAGHLLSPYAVSKYAGEHYLAVYHHLYGLSYTVFRFANVYGPRQLPKSDGGVVAIFTEAVKQGTPLTINGDGEQTRDFIYVEDVADAMMRAFDKGDNRVLNLSTGTPTSINRLIDELEIISGRQIERRYGPERPGDIRFSYLCNEKMKQALDWEPQFTLRDGLRLTWEAAQHA
jgi:UDP-glucose 4-epimerase